MTGFLLDAREPAETAAERGPDALRERLGELPRDRTIHVFCRSGQRYYMATRILLQNRFNARNISGGTLAYATPIQAMNACKRDQLFDLV